MDIEDKQREESFKPINKSKRKTTKLLFDEPKLNKKSKIIAKNDESFNSEELEFITSEPSEINDAQ